MLNGPTPHYSLTVWHGFNKPMMMNLVALAGGFALYLWLGRAMEAGRFKKPPFIGGLDGQRLFQGALVWLDGAVRRALRLASSQRLQPQMFLLVFAAVAVAAASLGGNGINWGDRERVPGSVLFALLWTAGGLCALTAAAQAKFHRLAALILVGGVGLMVCLTFMWFSALDLALTQMVFLTKGCSTSLGSL